MSIASVRSALFIRLPGSRALAAGAATLLAGAALWLPASASAAPAGLPATFWKGTTDGTWTGHNWASNAGGTATSAIPTTTDDVTFSIASGAAHQTTTLGQDFTIHSLMINDPVAVTINSGAGGPHMLTLSGNAGTGIDVQAAAGLVTIGAKVTLAGASNTITVNNAEGAVINGSVGGSNGLKKEGGGALMLAGTNTYTGPTIVNRGILLAGSTQAFGINAAVTIHAGGSLQLAGFSSTIGSLSGGGNVEAGNASFSSPPPLVPGLLLEATLTTGGLNTDATFSGLLGPFGKLSLVKVGTGTQVLSGINYHSGGTTLREGALAAGNTFAFGSGNLTMTGGTLRTDGGPLLIQLGSSYLSNERPASGSYNIVYLGTNIYYVQYSGGNILFTGGTYQAQVGGTTPGVTHDQIKTSGTANISGATVALVQMNGFHLALGDQILLISAAGGVAGGTNTGTPVPADKVTGLSAFSTSPLLVATVNLYPTAVVLELVQGSFSALASTLGFTANQSAVAAALDSLGQTGAKAITIKEINYLDSLAPGAIPSALDMLTPAQLTSIFHLATSLANVQTANIQRRLEEIRLAFGALIPVNSVNVSGGSGPQGPVGHSAKSCPLAPEDRWGLWFAGSGEFTHVGSTLNAAGFNLDSGGVTAGVDYRFTDHFAAGISLGYMNTTVSLANAGKIDANGGRVGAYATYFNRGLYVDASVSGGPNGYNTRRTTPNNTTATASPQGTEVNLFLGTGYDWRFGALTVGPTATYQYTNAQLDGFTERGGFAPLSVVRRNADSSRTALGFHATFDAKVGRVLIRPEARASWQHEFGDTSYSLTSTFATLGGNPFTVAGPSTGRDSLLVGAGVSVLWNDRFSTYAYYDGELLRTNYSSNNVSVGFRWMF